ncbi:MAG: hypothetical protein ACU0EX_09900 [Sulfitobacter sp.]|jgi:hypothetical protein|uniref:hypothetical protein n=1 Tax=Sulfitobacter sp. HI0076 TaxID=1822251 RepID=UPI0012374A07|nr:hypothetical protein [Sulfitobacter sp. HI0076]
MSHERTAACAVVDFSFLPLRNLALYNFGIPKFQYDAKSDVNMIRLRKCPAERETAKKERP